MGYSRLPSTEESPKESEKTLLDEMPSERQDPTDYLSKSRLPNSQASLVISATLFILSSILFTATIVLRSLPEERQCIGELSLYSPLLDVVEHSTITFNNSFKQPSKYRGPPTEELEAEWDRLWNYRDISLPEDKLSALTIDENAGKRYKMLPKVVGGGYAAGIEVFHQLHCLMPAVEHDPPIPMEFLLSLTLPPSLVSGPLGNRMHVDHCIETLRMTLMCHGDTTPMLRELDENAPLGSRAQFSNGHICVDFEALRHAMQERSVGTGRTLGDAQ